MKRNYLLLFFVIIILQFFFNTTFVSAIEVDEETIFSFEEDGYWKPGDKIAKDFYIRNVWGEGCYLKEITFKNSYIKDLDTMKNYSVEEAIQNGIIGNYNVIINLYSGEGKEELYNDSLRTLYYTNIKLKNKIYFNKDEKVKFEMVISFHEDSGNAYQNKYYEYVVIPKVYKIQVVSDKEDIEEEKKEDTGFKDMMDSIKTGDKDTIEFLIQSISLYLSLIMIFCIWKKLNFPSEMRCFNENKK